MLAKFFQLIKSHKIITTIIVLAVAGGTYYFINQSLNSGTVANKYVLALATTDTITSSVSDWSLDRRAQRFLHGPFSSFAPGRLSQADRATRV